jgi:propionyl-CoA carboxylase beta subunit
MSDVRAALEAALEGGPERHRKKVAEQQKLPVRERVARLLDPDSLA